MLGSSITPAPSAERSQLTAGGEKPTPDCCSTSTPPAAGNGPWGGHYSRTHPAAWACSASTYSACLAA